MQLEFNLKPSEISEKIHRSKEFSKFTQYSCFVDAYIGGEFVRENSFVCVFWLGVILSPGGLS